MLVERYPTDDSMVTLKYLFILVSTDLVSTVQSEVRS